LAIEEVDFWEADGVNGFLSNRSATVGTWACAEEAPLPGCAALQRLVWLIPTLCVETYCSSKDEQFQAEPFIARTELIRADVEAMLIVRKDGKRPIDQLSYAEIERCWLLASWILGAYQAVSRRALLSQELGAAWEVANMCPVSGKTGSACPVSKRKPWASPLDAVPKWFGNFLEVLSGFVGRPVTIAPEYCESILNNWRLEHSPGEPDTDVFMITPESVQRIRPICRWMAVPDEEWYRKMHLVAEAVGGRAIIEAKKSMELAIKKRDNSKVAAVLNKLATAIDGLVEFQRRQYDNKDSRGESTIWSRIKLFVAPDDTEEEYAIWIYAEGNSPFMPAMHSFLGIRWLEGKMKEFHSSLRKSSPLPHQELIDELASGKFSVRAYCLKAWRTAPVERLAAMEDAFNACLEALMRYCTARQRLVSRLFKDASVVKELSSQQEKVIRRSRLQLLQMRRSADAFHELAANGGREEKLAGKMSKS